MTAGCTAFVRLLSARIDGALEGAHQGQLEEHLAVCAPCRSRELSLLAQGEALRAGASRRLAALEASGAIDLSNFSHRVLRAVELDAHRPSRWERLLMSLRERWEHQRFALSASFGGVLAACATLALVLAAPHAPQVAGPLLASESQPSPQASIDALELMTGTTGAVFEVPGQTTVIWVSDEAVE